MKILNNILPLLITLASISLSYFFLADGLGLEISLIVTLGIVSGFGLFHFWTNSLTNTAKPGLFIYLLSFVISIGLTIHLKLTNEPQYRQFNSEYQIKEIGEYYAFYSDNYKILHTESKNIKFDSLHPLQVYEVYYIDLFGYEYGKSLVIKSKLMEDYQKLTIHYY